MIELNSLVRLVTSIPSRQRALYIHPSGANGMVVERINDETYIVELRVPGANTNENSVVRAVSNLVPPEGEPTNSGTWYERLEVFESELEPIARKR